MAIIIFKSIRGAAMSGAVIPRAITPQETAAALRQQLGSGYQVAPRPCRSRGKLTVSRGGVAFAAVYLARSGC
jgi:hypothetical protein